MNELALFAGAGGGILGGHILGWRTVCAVEHDPYAIAVLCARQNDGVLPPFPIWDEVRTFDGRPWRGRIDVVSGGFPCQDISSAGRGVGITGERSGLWSHMARIIGEVQPRYVFVENSPLLVSRGLAVVLGDLAEMGYDVRWGIVGAHHAGAPHKRDRCWIVADACGFGYRSEDDEVRAGRDAAVDGRADDADTNGRGCQDGRREPAQQHDWPIFEEAARAWRAEPGLVRVVHGVPGRVDRIRCLGNGQVPLAAALAWKMLTED